MLTATQPQIRRDGSFMADQPVVHIGENSPEHVAFRLMEVIARVEGIELYRSSDNSYATREWLLRTYRDCLVTVKGSADVGQDALTRKPLVHPPGR
jgi:hypothetical protein